MKTSLPRKQKGAAAIEFALVFGIFFAVFYGLISYTLPLLLMQSFNQAALEAVRQAMAVDPVAAADTYPTKVTERAKDTVMTQLDWIPTSFQFSRDFVSATYTGTTLNVTISYPTHLLYSVFPVLVVPGIGTVPNLPANLSARSSLQF
ncbi:MULTISPECIES: TadE/TadG family type IV pilus assembly protein [Pseudomonas fluorescens group]|uniref:TadE-like domain-containing protein n=3 Tax=Pseudomonas fluorescens group TaxID=136843 RepID=A0A3M4AP20_PSEMA|nr:MULTISPECIES: TadE/TadG family type IV pilus assembly protein [Pseudomonas fluorescens group]MCD7041322.1 pilus assembly protein [Pseudomonas petroselini]MCD7048211.1 pilus assembly protein [Pseudomonas petroselini]MCD7071817.1 pilus assembly protein [Pseudomonas petroselini]MCD7082755.1 pilus assembly protein [Pseudomonas petroselini]MCF5664480.1 pilus assembly protein [Pseudomonas marginalis]